MTRKLSDRDSSAAAMQKHQKTPPKKKSRDEIVPLAAQNSDLTPPSQLEISDRGVSESETTARATSDAGSIPYAASDPPASKQVLLRIVFFLVALTPLTLLVIAGNLNPEERGLGTHQQLGLPPCSLRLLAGVRCPACGMTTSWSYFARGNWVSSVSTNAGGFLLALLCLAMTVTAAQVVRCGRLPSPTVQTWLTLAAGGVLAVTLVDWIIRLQT